MAISISLDLVNASLTDSKCSSKILEGSQFGVVMEQEGSLNSNVEAGSEVDSFPNYSIPTSVCKGNPSTGSSPKDQPSKLLTCGGMLVLDGNLCDQLGFLNDGADGKLKASSGDASDDEAFNEGCMNEGGCTFSSDTSFFPQEILAGRGGGRQGGKFASVFGQRLGMESGSQSPILASGGANLGSRSEVKHGLHGQQTRKGPHSMVQHGSDQNLDNHTWGMGNNTLGSMDIHASTSAKRDGAGQQCQSSLRWQLLTFPICPHPLAPHLILTPGLEPLPREGLLLRFQI